MSLTLCPDELELIRWLDADLSPESAEQVQQHVAGCRACGQKVQSLRLLAEDVRAVPPLDLDVSAHVDSVLHQLDLRAAQPKRSRPWVHVAAYTAIAASVAVVGGIAVRHDSARGTWQARGNVSGPSLARDVGVQVYAKRDSWQPLRPSDTVTQDTALTAGLRNLGQAPAQLLLFAVDAQNNVHWIIPEYTKADENPSTLQLARTQNEQLLPKSVVFDDLAPGPLRIVTIVSPNVLRVSEVERLSPMDLSHGNLARHFAAAEIREMVIQVKATEHRSLP